MLRCDQSPSVTCTRNGHPGSFETFAWPALYMSLEHISSLSMEQQRPRISFAIRMAVKTMSNQRLELWQRSVFQEAQSGEIALALCSMEKVATSEVTSMLQLHAEHDIISKAQYTKRRWVCNAGHHAVYGRWSCSSGFLGWCERQWYRYP